VCPFSLHRKTRTSLPLGIVDPLIGEFVIDESFTVELLELVHPDEIPSRLPNGGRRKVSRRILIALLRDGVVRVVGGAKLTCTCRASHASLDLMSQLPACSLSGK
jgi:hypothetical protein